MVYLVYCVNKPSSIFLSLFLKFVNVNFVGEKMVWQTVPVFDDSQKEGVLKGVNFG